MTFRLQPLVRDMFRPASRLPTLEIVSAAVAKLNAKHRVPDTRWCVRCGKYLFRCQCTEMLVAYDLADGTPLEE